jgi:hypothetical protein
MRHFFHCQLVGSQSNLVFSMTFFGNWKWTEISAASSAMKNANVEGGCSDLRCEKAALRLSFDSEARITHYKSFVGQSQAYGRNHMARSRQHHTGPGSVPPGLAQSLHLFDCSTSLAHATTTESYNARLQLELNTRRPSISSNYSASAIQTVGGRARPGL